MFAPSATSFTPFFDQVLGVLAVDLVLGGAREGAVRLVVPEGIVVQGGVRLRVDGLGVLVHVLLDPPPPDVLQPHDKIELAPIDPLLVVDVAGGIGKGDHLGAQLDQLFHRVLGHVPGAGDEADLSLQGLLLGGEHFRCEVDAAVSRRLRPDQTPSPAQALAGEHSR